MNCPSCNYKFKAIASNATKEELLKHNVIPGVCERCAVIFIIIQGKSIIATPEQVKLIKKSPAGEMLDRALKLIKEGDLYKDYVKNLH